MSIQQEQIVNDMIICPLCDKTFRSLSWKHLCYKHYITVKEFKNKYPKLRKLTSSIVLRERGKKSSIRMKKNNPMKRPEIRKKVSETIKNLYKEKKMGFQIDKVQQKLKKVNQDKLVAKLQQYQENYDKDEQVPWHYLQKMYLDEKKTNGCEYCKILVAKMNVHHKDGDRNNNKKSNLILLCQHCHRAIHSGYKLPEKFELSITGHFDAAHFIPSSKDQCHNLHGHRWELKFAITGRRGATGIIIDFKEASKILEQILKKYDHKFLNDLFKEPTAENICTAIATELATRFSSKFLHISYLELYETPKYGIRIDFEDKTQSKLVEYP